MMVKSLFMMMILNSYLGVRYGTYVRIYGTLSSGYGTIQIHLQDTEPLVQGTEYRYKVQGQPQEDTATADRIEGRMVLVDSNYTIGENPPPFSAGRPLTVYVPNQSFPLVTSLITKIESNPLLEEPKK